MARSESAISKTFLKEGELSYSSKDTGGLTYLGLAYKKWPNANVWPKIFKIIQSVRPDLNDNILKSVGMGGPIINFTKTEEASINNLLKPLRKDIILFYKKEFWDVLGADDILSQTFAESFFDFSVNVGSKTGAILLQRYLEVKDDGNIGPKSLAKLNSELLKNTYNVHIDFTLIKIKKYCSIISDNSKQLANFHGWLNRSFESFDEIFEIEIIENLQKNLPDAIPSELVADICKLLNIYNLNKNYSLRKNDTELKKLFNLVSNKF